jgi:hypothetical protein
MSPTPFNHSFINGSAALCLTLAAFQFLNLYTIGRISWKVDQFVAWQLPTQDKTN